VALARLAVVRDQDISLCRRRYASDNCRMYRLFVLGAGFSRPAGLPLGSGLLADVVREARRLGSNSVLLGDIDRYLKYLADAKGIDINPELVNLEEFMSFLDIEHALRFSGSDTWSDDGNRSQLLVRYLIAKVLYRRQMSVPAETLQLYDKFVSHLEGCDRILTFNYDTLVEDALDRAGKPYRLTPGRYSKIDGSAGKYAVGSENDVTILKLHGSLDWFDIGRYRALAEQQRKLGSTRRHVTLYSIIPKFGWRRSRKGHTGLIAL